MKHRFLGYASALVLCASPMSRSESQHPTARAPTPDRRIQRLEILADVWGKLGLYHPSVVTKNLDWDSVLVATIPLVERASTREELVAALNRGLFAPLQDPLSYARTSEQADLVALVDPPGFSKRVLRRGVGYVAVTNSYLPYESGFLRAFVDSVRALGADTLIVDLRWWSKVVAGGGEWLGIWLPQPTLLGSRLTRVHYGFTTPENWQFSERRLFGHPKDIPSLRGQYSESGVDSIPVLNVPTVFLVNLESMRGLEAKLDALQAKPNVAVVLETSGRMDEGWDIQNYPSGVRVRIHGETLLSRTGAVGSRADSVVASADNERLADLAAAVLRSKPLAPARVAYTFPVHEERRYAESMAPLSREERLLGLMKIWTTIGAMDAYLYRASADWSTALREWIPRVESAPTLRDYFLTLRDLGTTLRDAHVSVNHPSTDERAPRNRRLPVRLERVQGRVLIAKVDTAAAHGLDLKAGDELVAIDGMSIAHVEALWRHRLSMAIEKPRLEVMWFGQAPIYAPADSPIVLTVRDARGRVRTVRTTRTYDAYSPSMRPFAGLKPTILPGNLGYIEFYGVPSPRAFDSALVAFKDTRGLILDFRYPRPGWVTSDPFYLVSRFVDTPFVSIRVQLPMLTMYRGPAGRGWFEQLNIKAPFRERGAPRYTHPIVAITNGFSQSTAETLPNQLRASGRATFVGSETEGTNGGAPDFSLPGGAYMVFTHERVLNPDGSEFQGVGIVPDVYVEPTVEGVRAGRDEVLERAVEVLRTRVSAPKRPDSSAVVPTKRR